MGSYQAFELEELQADRSRSYAEFVRRPGLSMGIYHLQSAGRTRSTRTRPTRSTWCSRAGRRSRWRVSGLDVGPGRVVSVDVGADHRFVDVTEDLQVLVVFAPPDHPEH